LQNNLSSLSGTSYRERKCYQMIKTSYNQKN
jgi:hypothetical protein